MTRCETWNETGFEVRMGFVDKPTLTITSPSKV